RRDADERRAMANGVNGGVYRRDDDGLTRAQLRGVLYPVVVGERLRRDPVGRRDREKRLARRDRVDLKAWRVFTERCGRRASRDDDRPFERTRSSQRNERRLRLRERERSETLELRCGDNRPYRDHRGDDAAR